MKKISLLFFSIFIISSFSLVLAQGFNYDAFFGFPYQINFNQNELNYLKNLDPKTLKSLVDLAKLIKDKNFAQASTTTKSYNNPIPTTKPATNSYQPKPVTPQPPPTSPPSYSGDSGLTDSDSISNPNFNPAKAPPDSPSKSPLKDAEMADFSKLPPAGQGECTNFGITGNMNGVVSKVKFDTNCLCIAFGGKIKMVSGYRSGDPRNHGQGFAIDIAENNYKDRKKDSMLIVALIGLNYNIGSYHPGFGSFHADRENSPKWKTWSGVAHTDYSGSYARNYYQQVQDALNLIGMSAQSAKEFRNTYGNPTQSVMSKKARDYIDKNGNDALKKCMAAQTI